MKIRKMTMSKSKISFVYIIADLFLIIISLLMGGLWLINTQVAFIGSMLIIFASFFSYRKMIEKKLEDGDIVFERDLLDKIDDKYELFEEDGSLEEKEMSKEEFVKYYKEERKKSGGLKRTFSNLFKSGRGIFNPIRIGAYVLLSLSMLFLIRQEFFSAIPFLVGVGAIPISSVFLGFLIKD